VKLFVDKEKRKVLFAESDKEFVDVLFGFLTMPLGTIVRLLDKQSQMGCLHEVYKSVEDLSTEYFQTKACKAMLLKPLNALRGTAVGSRSTWMTPFQGWFTSAKTHPAALTATTRSVRSLTRSANTERSWSPLGSA
jgi:hypothetical protein